MLAGEDPEVRRLAVLALSGSASTIDDEERLGYIRRSLSDTSQIVRLEGGVPGPGVVSKRMAVSRFSMRVSDQSLHVVWPRSMRSETLAETSADHEQDGV